MMILVCGGIIYAVTALGIGLVQYCDDFAVNIKKRDELLLAACSGTVAAVIARMNNVRYMSEREAVLWAFFAGSLLFACLTDVKTRYVYQFTWWLAGAAGGLLLWARFESDFPDTWGFELRMFDCMCPLLVYILLQELFFCRFYGRADCHAFVVCAVALCALGMGMTEYLMHMILSFLGLSVVQAFRGNINHRGCLKRPVAFLPYITLSFWVLLFF